MITQLIVLSVFVLSATYVHVRGQYRKHFLRQMLDFTSIFAPVNVLIYLFSKAPMKPYQDLSKFPELNALRDNWRVIADEARTLYDGGQILPYAKLNDIGFYNFARRGWTRFYLDWYGYTPPSAERLCPKTVALLKEVKSMRGAMFAILPPGGKLVPHRDPFAGSLRYHLGLVTPNDDRCNILVDGIPYSWRDGEGVMFDETYMHWAFNKTDQARIILFCDIERPMWTPVMRGFNRLVGRMLGTATAAQNFPDEKLGVLNRIFPYLYVWRTVGKRLKKFNPRLYYVGKYVGYIAIIYAIFFAFR